VDFQTDEQLGDRFLKYNVEASHERRKKIIGHMQTLDECAKKPNDDRFEKLVCQALTYDLKMKTFPVKIPFSKKIKFDGDPRAYGIFRDMIKSSAVFRYCKRKQDDAGILIATTEDFENAKSLYVELGGHDRNKYSTAELKVLDAIIAKGDKEATQADIQEKAELSAGRVSDILNGRGKSELGLLHKCKGIIVNNDKRPIKYKLRAGFDPRYYVSIELEGGST
jgi:hypothetical protein